MKNISLVLIALFLFSCDSENEARKSTIEKQEEFVEMAKAYEVYDKIQFSDDHNVYENIDTEEWEEFLIRVKQVSDNSIQNQKNALTQLEVIQQMNYELKQVENDQTAQDAIWETYSAQYDFIIDMR